MTLFFFFFFVVVLAMRPLRVGKRVGVRNVSLSLGPHIAHEYHGISGTAHRTSVQEHQY